MIKAAADMYGVTVKMVARGSAASGNSSPDMGEEVYEVVKGLGVYSDIEKIILSVAVRTARTL